MDKAIHTAMSGAVRTMQAQQQHANNLANVNTGGFKADYSQAVANALPGEGMPTRVMVQTGDVWSDFAAGAMQQTGRSLDVALATPGFLQVNDIGGEPAYSRGGSLTLSAEGMLADASGHLVMGQNGPVEIPPHEQLLIGEDGTISILPEGDNEMAVIDQLQLVNAEQPLIKGTDGLFRTENGAPPVADPTVRLASGFIEASNVNSVREMVSFMSLNRQFEMQLKVMSTSRDMAAAGDVLLRG
ncbi:flagellar basal body rod protein FlgF [Endozoicomonas ascidiicola]|uniref:flagellar basal body rod protein FlgF n=1 Tax=Endozoicomonas ascidiicola TaxID=1698521 RepID=UPI00082EC3F2|nr:flagellar basal body rod protein FlgF [Endozoicomonas ascidiicola]